MTAAPALSMSGISKAFPGVHALDGVDFDCLPGESTRSAGRTAPASRR